MRFVEIEMIEANSAYAGIFISRISPEVLKDSTKTPTICPETIPMNIAICKVSIRVACLKKISN